MVATDVSCGDVAAYPFLCRQAWEALSAGSPQRSEDINSIMASAIIIPGTAKPVFIPAYSEAIRMADGRRRKNVPAMTV